MPDPANPEGQEPTPTPTPTATTPAAGEAPADPWAGIPDQFAWAKAAVENANREAASRRVALREAEEKLSAAKTPEEFEAAVAEFKNGQSRLEAELARERAARKHGLADDVVEFLTGTTEEQIEAQAAKLAALKPASQETVPPVVVTVPAPSGGVTPSSQPTEQDGRALWRAHKARR
jgi:hypothetical protein